jgi:hypothetical protein
MYLDYYTFVDSGIGKKLVGLFSKAPHLQVIKAWL